MERRSPSSPPDFSIRSAEFVDAPALADLYLTIRTESVPAVPAEIHPPESVHQWIREVLFPSTTIEVVVSSGEPVGFLAHKTGWIEHFWIRRAFTGFGIGSVLLEQVKAIHPEGLDLWTFESNVRAHHFYEQRGFLLVEQTNGEGNEERSPDRRYSWMPISSTNS